MASLLKKIAEALGKRGPLEFLALVKKNLLHEFRWYLDGKFDRRHGTKTVGIVELDKLGIAGDNVEQGVYYEATPTAVFHQLLGALKIDHSGFAYCDLGSGMGRTLLLASDYPFARILGVEFSEILHRQAQENIRTYRGGKRRCEAIESICMDAAEFEFPGQDLVVFMYNPFWAELMERVLGNLKRSLASKPRRVLLVYYNPLSGYVVDKLDFLPFKKNLPLRFEITRAVQRKAIVYSNSAI